MDQAADSLRGFRPAARRILASAGARHRGPRTRHRDGRGHAGGRPRHRGAGDQGGLRHRRPVIQERHPAQQGRARPEEDGGRRSRSGPLCVSPADLYTGHARERIGDLLEGWLARHKATPWELLHRPDLIERLEASGIELQHAIQKVAVPEAQARGRAVHEMMRHFQQLTDRAIERVLKDGRKGAFPDLSRETLRRRLRPAARGPRARSTCWAAAVAIHLAGRGRLERQDRSPARPRRRRAEASRSRRALAFHVLEQPLSEILGSRLALADLLGHELDLGGQPRRPDPAGGGSARSTPWSAPSRPSPPSCRRWKGRAARLAGWLEQPHVPGRARGGGPAHPARAAGPPPPAARRPARRDRHPARPGHGADLGGGQAAAAGGRCARPSPSGPRPSSRRDFVEAVPRRRPQASWTRPGTWSGCWRTSPGSPTAARPAAVAAGSASRPCSFETEMRGGHDTPAAPARGARRAADERRPRRRGRAANAARCARRSARWAGVIEADAKLVQRGGQGAGADHPATGAAAPARRGRDRAAWARPPTAPRPRP